MTDREALPARTNIADLRAKHAAVEQQINAEGLHLLMTLREAAEDASMRVSAPGEAEPGEFYLTVDGGNSYAVRIEYLG